MSNAGATPLPIPPDAPPPTPSARALNRTRRRSYTARVALDTLGHVTAKLGVAWVLIVAFFAVFAPVLASSHPFILKMLDAKTGQHEWSSPWLRHLTPADVTLFVALAAFIVLCFFKRVAFGAKAAIFFGVMMATIVLAVIFVRPPVTVDYQQYREAESRGNVSFILRPPIPYSPTDRLGDQFDADHPHPWAPSTSHLLGTERYGGDIFSRMIHASRIALAVGFIAEGIAVVIGVLIGGAMGYFAGVVDLLGMRLVEIFSAIPQIYLLLTFVAFFQRNLYLIMAIIGVTSWVGYALFTRAEFLRLRNQDFVQAARACGLPLRSILFRHMLPNGMSPILVNLSFGVASAILAETSLSFLGLGLVDEPSWGQLLNQALGSGGKFVWWLAVFPGLAIFLTVFSYNLIGEALRDEIDPHLKKASQL